MIDPLFASAVKLHGYLTARHWNGQSLIGPDVGIRINYRVGRFVKSYLPMVNWRDDYYYLQGQGYWVLGNWRLLDLIGEESYRQIALNSSESMLATQAADGSWEYPNREWKGRIATAEGTWGSIGLLESYRHSGRQAFLDAVLKWHRFLTQTIGYQQIGDELAVNYFARRGHGTRVPNNSAFVLRFLAELAETTRDRGYLEPAPGLVRFLSSAQTEPGEFPYAVPGQAHAAGRPHFQCFQYNAFECLDLIRYYEITRDETVRPLISRVLDFLATGVAPGGQVYYQCDNHHTTVTYHTAVVAAALKKGAELGLRQYTEQAERAYDYVRGRQRPDGGFPHSWGDYRLLADNRSYPRYLAMILYHLLVGATSDRVQVSGKADAALEAR